MGILGRLRSWRGSSPAARRAALLAIWAEVLERPVTLDDGFFGLGANSLDAVRIVSRAEERFGVAVPVRLVLESGSVAEMADRIFEQPGDGEPGG